MRKMFFCLLTGTVIAGNAKAQSWVTIPSSTHSVLSSCSFGSASTFYTVGSWGYDSSTILKSTDAGISFFHLSTSFLTPGQIVSEVCFTSADTGFISGSSCSAAATPACSSGFIYRTTNGGATWTPVLTGMPGDFSSMCFPSSSIGYASGSAGGGMIYKTTDGGLTWSSIYSGSTPLTLGALFMVNTTTGYVVGQNSTTHEAVLVKITGGTVSGVSTFGTYNWFGGVCFTSPTTGFTTASIGGTTPVFYMLKTTDGGTTWTPVYTSGYNYEGCIKFEGTIGYAIGGWSLSSPDGGNTWALAPSVTSTTGSLYAMDIRSNIRIIVGEYGSIIRQAGPAAASTLEAADNNYKLYPNPMTQQAQITFGEPQKNTTVCISDIMGRAVKHMAFSGSNLIIDREGLPPGMYTVNIANEEGSTTTRLVIE